MKVYRGLEQFKPPPGETVLTIGNFDGVHRAHRHLIEVGRSLKSGPSGVVAVLTFEPHPLAVVAPGREPPRLSTPERKLHLLEQAGADLTVVAHSEPRLLGMEPEDFVREIIQKRFAPKHIVEGPSFGFGKGRRGDVNLLQSLAASFQCTVHIVDPVTVVCERGDTLLVSSSLIRKLLASGDVERAALCLGRCYALHGTVVRGDGRGRTLGVPTANLAPDDQLVPGQGVYAGWAEVDAVATKHQAAISIGPAHTFGGSSVRIEAHLLDFTGDLYDRELTLSFVRRLRDQQKFSSSEALVEQLKRDIETVRSLPTPDIASPNPPASGPSSHRPNEDSLSCHTGGVS